MNRIRVQCRELVKPLTHDGEGILIAWLAGSRRVLVVLMDQYREKDILLNVPGTRDVLIVLSNESTSTLAVAVEVIT